MSSESSSSSFNKQDQLRPPRPIFSLGEMPKQDGTQQNPFGTPGATPTESPFNRDFGMATTDASIISAGSDGPPPPRVRYSEGVTTHSRASSTADFANGGLSARASVLRQSTTSMMRQSYASPPLRQVASFAGSSTSAPVKAAKRTKSTMLSETEPIQKPWLDKATRDPRERMSYLITYGAMFLGIVASALRIYFGYKSVPMLTGNLCLVLDDDFSNDSDPFGPNGHWFREIELGGFGNGEFEMTTSSSNNSFVQDGVLYLVPTLTSDVIGQNNVMNGYTYNLTDCTWNITDLNAYPSSTASSDGSSSSNVANMTAAQLAGYYANCGAVSNQTSGAIINPVQSARISTRYSASIRYGKVEVVARLPQGDWLWPAIWMLPVNNTYGAWPMSGEIDIMESRGNNMTYPDQGSNVVRASLNWGPLTWLNAVYKTYGWWSQPRESYADAFHTYSMEWDEKFIRMYVDTRLHHTLSVQFNEPFFSRGDFPAVVQNGTDSIVLKNPWEDGSNATPFDQDFYLIMNVAVGGTNGWFPDRAGNKPWLDNSQTAMRDFAEAQGQWYPTWPSDVTRRGMAIDSVKMWQLC